MNPIKVIFSLLKIKIRYKSGMTSDTTIIRKRSPWSQEILFEGAGATSLDFIQALQKAKAAQELFKKSGLEQRAQWLEKWKQAQDQEKNDIVQAVAEEQGLPINFVLREVVEAVHQSLESTIAELKAFSAPETISPIGVMGLSVAWPMAYLWISHGISQALAAGNGVIIKVPSLAPVSAQRISKLLAKLDLPEGLVNFLYGGGLELNNLMAGHPGINGFLFRGHHRVSGGLIGACATQRKKIQFYLGGKNSSLIHPDFDFENNMESLLRPALTGQGQLGLNTHRFFIPEAREGRFYEALAAYVTKLKPSQSPRDTGLWGPMITHASADEFMEMVQQVKADQGSYIPADFVREGAHVRPIFTKNMSNCSELQQDEVKGPLFIVTSVKYVFEMAKWTNTGYLGQSAIFWGPKEKSGQVLSQLDVGQGLYQRWDDFLNWGLPRKQSFFGVPGVKWSRSFFSDIRKIDV